MTSEPFAPRLTNRLVLRCVRPEDAIPTSRLMSPEVSRWLASWPVPFTPAMAGERIDGLLRLAFRGDALPFAITSKGNGRLLGWATVTRNDPERSSAAMSFWLGEEHHGKGTMREAAPAILAAGFDLLRVDEIEAGAQVANIGSFAVMRSCGMSLAGDRHVHASARGQDELCRFYKALRRAPDERGQTAARGPGRLDEPR